MMNRENQTTEVNGRDGRLGVLDLAALDEAEGERHRVLVHLDIGQDLWVPVDLLQRQSDGSFELPLTRSHVIPGAVSPYYEGETLVIPVVEEELVIQKRWVIKEEVRITRRRQQVNRQQPVTLRQEQVIVEPVDEAGDRVG
jgi:hypothetical protein